MTDYSRRTPAGVRCSNRALEWLTASMLISYAVTTFATPDTIGRGAFRYLLEIGVTPTLFAWSVGVGGVLRICALYFNGSGLPWSARVRALGSIFGALVFAYMSLSLIFLTRDTATISLGVGTHVLLAVAELYSVLRAGADVNEDNRRALSTGAVRE